MVSLSKSQISLLKFNVLEGEGEFGSQWDRSSTNAKTWEGKDCRRMRHFHTLRLRINYQEKMSFYNGEMLRMPHCTLSLIMRKQSYKSKLRDILLGMDIKNINVLTELKKGGGSVTVF